MSRMPSSWASTTLAELGGTVGGKTPNKSESRYWSDGTIPWVSPKDMKVFRIDDSEDHLTPAGLDAGMKLIPPDSVLFVARSGILAHTLPVAVTGKGVTINQDIKAILPRTDVHNSRFVAYGLRAFESQILNVCSKAGTTVASIEMPALESMPLPLAPLPEQQRIADKLDAVLARVDACRERLANVVPLLKRFRQSVLSAATSGRLTEDWEHAGRDEWVTLRADEVCEKVQSGGTPKAGFTESSGIPFLKVYNIVGQVVDFDYRPQFVSVDTHLGELKKSRALPGDVLMNIVGPPLGKVAVVPDTHDEWNINQAITLFRPSGRISTGWLYVLLCEGAAVRGVLDRTKGSVGQVNISLSQCRAFEFPVPSIKEQAEIIRRVETLFGLANRLEARLANAQAATDRLTPALLAKAFRGELVPQDPADEPAVELLRRLNSQAQPAKVARRSRAA